MIRRKRSGMKAHHAVHEAKGSGRGLLERHTDSLGKPRRRRGLAVAEVSTISDWGRTSQVASSSSSRSGSSHSRHTPRGYARILGCRSCREHGRRSTGRRLVQAERGRHHLVGCSTSPRLRGGEPARRPPPEHERDDGESLNGPARPLRISKCSAAARWREHVAAVESAARGAAGQRLNWPVAGSGPYRISVRLSWDREKRRQRRRPRCPRSPRTSPRGPACRAAAAGRSPMSRSAPARTRGRLPVSPRR